MAFLKLFGLRRKIDLVPLALVVVVGAAQFGGFFMCDRPAMTVLISAVLLLPRFAVATVCHNHVHVPMCRGRLANAILDLVLYLETGMLPAKFRIQHNLGHHRFYTDPAQDLTTTRRDGSAMGRLEYTVRFFIAATFEAIRIGRDYPVLLRRFYRAQAAALIAVVGLLAINPIGALILFVVPMNMMWFTFALVTYDDHIGLHSTNELEASHSKTNRILNILIFNNGYHLAHHVKPGVHWSELPAVHESLKGRIRVPAGSTFLNRIFA
jgi:beta-carotene hydroxylase